MNTEDMISCEDCGVIIDLERYVFNDEEKTMNELQENKPELAKWGGYENELVLRTMYENKKGRGFYFKSFSDAPRFFFCPVCKKLIEIRKERL
jgi:hypothetical protein